MGFTVVVFPVARAHPTRLVSAVTLPRTVEVTNNGPAPVWLGTQDVTAGRGRQLLAGDDPFVFVDGDELYAAAWSPATVTVWVTT